MHIGILMVKFTIIYNAEERGYSGKCLEIPEAISEGETLEELKANMIDAIILSIKSIVREAQENHSRLMIIEVPTT